MTKGIPCKGCGLVKSYGLVCTIPKTIYTVPSMVTVFQCKNCSAISLKIEEISMFRGRVDEWKKRRQHLG